ncbi:transposase family protein [Planctomycetota bacterium]
MGYSLRAIQQSDTANLRGYAAQAHRRDTERQLRKGALIFSRWMQMQGRSLQESAVMLDVQPSLLYEWQHRWCSERLAAHGRGRPVEDITADQLEALQTAMELLGVQTGVQVLQGLFPGIPRRELEYRLKEYRKRWQELEAFMIETIRWRLAGRVWAMDHCDASLPIDGKYPYLLAVRDLGSGEQLLSLPVEHKDGASTRAALERLFKQYGPPLVLKSDNGSALICREVSLLLYEKKVKKLLSPPGYPCYNGSIEAGIGSLETRTHHEAARHDRPGEWTCDDVEAARRQANYTARPRGAKGPTPQQMWEKRSMISNAERELFLKTVDEQLRRQIRKHKDEKGEFNAQEAARMERAAIATALKKLGYYVTRRRRIIPPIFRKIFRKIS